MSVGNAFMDSWLESINIGATETAMIGQMHWLAAIGGYIFCTPECFIMGKAVDKDAPLELLLNVKHKFESDTQNAWLIWQAASRTQSLDSFFRFEPYRLPYIGWSRRGESADVRFYQTERILNKISKARN